MAKIIKLNSRNNMNRSNKTNNIYETYSQDSEVKEWKQKTRKWWNNYTRIVTVILDIVFFSLIVSYAINLIHLPVIELILTGSFRIRLNKRSIFKYIFYKDSS
jgi:hypothetical protein